jgi:hypothetical protein
MPNSLREYIDTLKGALKFDSEVKASVADELRAHLEDKNRELKQQGLSDEEAHRAAIESFGPVQEVASQMARVHNRGTCKEAFLATLPHLLIALLFASWHRGSPAGAFLVLGAITSIVIYGWSHNKPMWLFPWLGYYLLPVMLTGVVLVYLDRPWTWAAALVYVPCALFVIGYIVKQTARRDRLYVSLMLAPLPIICAWLFALGSAGTLLSSSVGIRGLALDIPGMVASFLVLGAATFTFILVSERWCKVFALLIPLLLVFGSITVLSKGDIAPWGWGVLAFCLLTVTSPACLECRSL